ncbi:hypothetical protein [Lelliottia amnigena]|uniref:hypothetical protein n=1 Tax=Lelliottia amnigena TaxID=61646 RepID=UPI001C5C86CB|nr:hypothetical protein [Lelliottia amnigena]QXZ18274.1 hypothetical protein I6L75_14240 [Lelliottia amnigena]
MSKTSQSKLSGSGVTFLTPELARLHEMQDNDSNEVTPAFGGNGGGGMDNLDKRVTALEEDVKVIRNDLTTLMVRSENFATKADISDIRTEIAESRGSIKQEMAAQRGEIKAEMAALLGELTTEMATLRGELKTEMSTQSGTLKTELQKAITTQTVLLLTIIPAAFALVTFLFGYFKN